MKASPQPAEIPLVGRPALLPFSEASARFVVDSQGQCRVPFAVVATATPTELAARTPLTYTVTVRAGGPVLSPPKRIDLREVAEFKRSFYIEDVIDEKRGTSKTNSWHWRYRLTPRTAEVDEVPGFPFVFYNPDLQPPEKAFQVIYSDPIPLAQRPVRPHPGPVDVDEDLPLATGPEVLARYQHWAGPGIPLWTIVLIGPPLLSAICYLGWRRLYPDPARRAARRRSRALREALRQLGRAGQSAGREQAEGVTQALVGYLHGRLDLGPREPTPEEVSMHLRRLGLSAELIQGVADLLADCAAVRFGPSLETTGLVERARRAVLSLEEASCPP